MSIKNKEEYINSLRKQDLKAYLFGKKVTGIVDNPYIRLSISSALMTYER